MIYTDKTNKAMKICYEAHAGQVDKSGLPYVFHPFHVAEQMDDEEAVIVALLHDVVEDTDWTIADLEKEGFGDAVIDALRLLTHEEGVSYADYVHKISTNTLATKVKLADLRHNMDFSRLTHEPTDEDKQRKAKYQQSEKILLDTLAKAGADKVTGGGAQAGVLDGAGGAQAGVLDGAGGAGSYGGAARLSDAVFGLAIGDALGVPYEFMRRGSFTCRGMVGYGTHSQPEGTWSDDTSMTIATAKSIKDNHGKIDVDDIRKNFLKWERDEEFTAGGELFDIGMATSEALRTGRGQSGEYDNGNGSLMRILPLAFTDCTDDEIRAVSAITHGHWISKEACVIYVHVARRLLAGEDIEDILPTLKYDKPFDRLCELDQLEADHISSGGYVVDTLEAALWALVHEVGYRDTVLTAINLGSDTDTVGAVTGGLAGIMYGLKGDFTKECMEKLQNKELIRDCLWGAK